MTDPANSPRPVIFGEVLFDRFPDHTVLGGAPFNVAWHLQGLGYQPLFVGGVGDDDLGEQVRRAMADWGMDTAGLQVDPVHPTGRVEVSLEGGEPQYTIVAEQAYDYVDPARAQRALAGGEGLLYHGSLAARGAVSRGALKALREAGLPAFVDVNLREPWWSHDRLAGLLQGSQWVKLNQAELMTLSPAASPEAAGEALRARYGLDALIVTRGEAGAFALTPAGTIQVEAPAVTHMVDSVGAGDGFSAAVIAGLLSDWDWATILQRAVRFAARICEQRGATAANVQLYAQTLEAWGLPA